MGMDASGLGWGMVGLAVGVAFAVSISAELILLSTDKKGWVALARALKAIIIPALIAIYAIVAASIISGSNG